jgi:tetratricopeptide (TPR) repeat protein
MIFLAQASLFLWLPAVVIIFATVKPPRKAVVLAFVFAWLALPSRIGYKLPGLPDYTKMSATLAGVLLAALLFDAKRLLSVRPKWYDLPMFVWCWCPLPTALANDLGAYEGFSHCLDNIVSWGLPYLIGRAYLGDLDGARQLALGIAVGGLVYVVPCLIEVRMSPQLERWVYGVTHWEDRRYGGYRPKVFLSSGLELGMWMTNSSLLCQQLWACGTIKRLWAYPMGMLLAGLLVTTVLCKSTGAILLLVGGMFILWASRRFKVPWLVLALVAMPLMYSATRSTNFWSARELVEFARQAIGPDRAQSLEFRLDNEDILAAHALKRPFFGWGRYGRSFVVVNGVETVVDGYWMIALGINGLVGMASMELSMVLPMILTLRRFPVRTWSDPRVGPVAGLSMLLCLMMVDFLSNAMMNPIYALAIGCLVGQSPVKLGGHLREAEQGLGVGMELASEGRTAEAEAEFRRAFELAAEGDDAESRRVAAEALDGLGHSLMATGRPDEAVPAFHEALVFRDDLAGRDPELTRFRDLAIAREGLARALAEAGRTAEAIEERRIALAVWGALASAHPRDLDLRDRRVDAQNDLAWLLATDLDPATRAPARAVELAEAAALTSPERAACWNTLGVARYRLGDWAGAVEALERSAALDPDGGTAFDHYFLAMAWRRLDDDARAREWLERGLAWSARFRPGHPPLERFRDEAEALLAEPGASRLEPG